VRYFILGLAMGLSFLAHADEEGFLHQGKSYTVFRDGKKVGKTFAELFPERAPAQAPDSKGRVGEIGDAWTGGAVFWIRHATPDGKATICYGLAVVKQPWSLSCVRE
jgi:hypothetical protein